MNRIRNKFFKPFVDNKRTTLRSSSMARRRNMNSLNRVGAAYGVAVKNNGEVYKKTPKTANTGKRKIKYKHVDQSEKKKILHEVFGAQK